MPEGVGALPWFLITAFITIASPGAGLAGSQEMSVTTRSGFPVGVGVGVAVGVGVGAVALTVIVLVRMLLSSFSSTIRSTSSTHAWMVCVPATAVQVEPTKPPFAVTVTHSPGPIEALKSSDQTLEPRLLSAVKATP